ncbi:type II toxin-antitoxin system PemK/MazF family toxin [Kaistella sp.]|uniref:type II toxin-antitoxin system PemK/MazF family toxin n=1 Tax=Kaistella sp. TaxID=2782235 RepID=UPI003C4F2AE8
MIYQFEIWLADLNPKIGSETGKTRPVLIVQTNLLNEEEHTSTIICPITTKVRNAPFIRVFLEKGSGGVFEDCDIMVDQIRTIDNSRFIKKIGKIPPTKQKQVVLYLKAVLDIE